MARLTAPGVRPTPGRVGGTVGRLAPLADERGSSVKRAAALVSVVLLASCGTGSDTAGSTVPGGPPGKNTVILRDIAFKPDKLTVKRGDTVTWRFEDQGIAHDVVAEDDSFKSDVKDAGTFRHTFDAVGSHPYLCSLHPTQMKGTVVVRGP